MEKEEEDVTVTAEEDARNEGWKEKKVSVEVDEENYDEPPIIEKAAECKNNSSSSSSNNNTSSRDDDDDDDDDDSGTDFDTVERDDDDDDDGNKKDGFVFDDNNNNNNTIVCGKKEGIEEANNADADTTADAVIEKHAGDNESEKKSGTESEKNTIWKKLKKGSRVAIFWPDDNMSYSCTVETQHPTLNSRWFVIYDDNETEWTDMSQEILRWCDDDEHYGKDAAEDDDDDEVVPSACVSASAALLSPKNQNQNLNNHGRNDVLSMKGAAAQQTQHPGNLFFNSLCEEQFPHYDSYSLQLEKNPKESRIEKLRRQILLDIIQAVKDQPGGACFRYPNGRMMQKCDVLRKAQDRMRQIKKPKLVPPSFVGPNDVVFAPGSTSHLFTGNAKLRSLLDEYEQGYLPEFFGIIPPKTNTTPKLNKKGGVHRGNKKTDYQIQIANAVIDIIVHDRGGKFRDKTSLNEIPVDPSTPAGQQGRQLIIDKIHQRFKDMKREITKNGGITAHRRRTNNNHTNLHQTSRETTRMSDTNNNNNNNSSSSSEEENQAATMEMERKMNTNAAATNDVTAVDTPIADTIGSSSSSSTCTIPTTTTQETFTVNNNDCAPTPTPIPTPTPTPTPIPIPRISGTTTTSPPTPIPIPIPIPRISGTTTTSRSWFDNYEKNSKSVIRNLNKKRMNDDDDDDNDNDTKEQEENDAVDQDINQDRDNPTTPEDRARAIEFVFDNYRNKGGSRDDDDDEDPLPEVSKLSSIPVSHKSPVDRLKDVDNNKLQWIRAPGGGGDSDVPADVKKIDQMLPVKNNNIQQHNIKEKYIVKRTGCTSAISTITWGSKPHQKEKTVKKSRTTKKKKLKKMKHNDYENDGEEEEEIDYDSDSDSMTNDNENDDSDDDDDDNNDDEFNNQAYYYYEDNMWKIKKKEDIIDDEHEHNQKVKETQQQHKISREERMKRREEQQILQQLKIPKQKVSPDEPRPFENGEAEVNPQQQTKNTKKRRRSSGKSKFHEYIPSEGEVALMSDYEKLRYHKMKRNQERLSQLGLV